MIVVTGTNEVITFSSSQSTTGLHLCRENPHLALHMPMGINEDSFGFNDSPYGFVEHTLKEGTIHVS